MQIIRKNQCAQLAEVAVAFQMSIEEKTEEDEEMGRVLGSQRKGLEGLEGWGVRRFEKDFQDRESPGIC